MMAMAAPGLVLFSLFFGFVGLFVGADFFILPAALGLVIGVALITREALRLRRIRQLQDHGVVVQARTERRERASVRIMGMTPVRLVCTTLAPARFSGTTYRSDWYARPGAGIEDLPSSVMVLVDPSRPGRYHVDLRSFGVPTSRLDWRSQIVTAAIMTVGLVSVVFGTLAVGEGPAGLRPFAARGSVAAEGPRVGTWSFTPDTCRSGAPKGIDGALLYDASTHDPQLALIRDAAAGDVLDAMVEREHRTKRFFASDCRVLKVDLRPMDSAVNRVTNLEGEIDAECEAAGDRLSAHVTFQFCH